MAEASVFVRNNGKRVNIVAHTDGVCGAVMCCWEYVST